MSDYIEHEIVELEFDNKDFEKNVDTSLKTLDKLKTSLQFENSSKGFENIQNGIKSIDFSPLTNKISSVENQFTSFLGRLELNIKDFLGSQVISEFKGLFDKTLGLIKSGGYQRALNIEQAKFKIKGLNKDWDTVYEDMDYAVSGTAYGIDQAASAAAQFLASNVKTGEDMKAALRGISGIAAMTSSSYDDVAAVFTAAAGKGRVMAIELNRIAAKGINAKAALADFVGTTEAGITEMVSKGEIDFLTFAKAMDAAFGEHAKKANETFTGSLSNVKAALSRIGELYYEPWIQGMIPWFNALREAIDVVKNALKSDLGGEKGNTFANTLKEFILAVSDFKISLLKAFAPTIEDITDKLEFWNDVLKRITATINAITNQINKYFKIKEKLRKQDEDSAVDKSDELSSLSSDADQTAAEMQGISTTIAGAGIVLNKEIGLTIGSIIDRYKALYEAQKNVLESTTNLFSKWSHNYRTSFKNLYKNLKSNKKGLETLAKDMATLESKGFLSNEFIQNLKNMGTSGADIVHALAKANDKDLKEYMKTWDTTQGMFDDVASDWTKGAKEEAEKSLNEITGIPDAKMEDYVKTYEDMFNQMGVSAGNGFTAGFSSTYDSFEDLFNKEIEAIEAMKAALESENDAAKETEDKPFENVIKAINDLIGSIGNWSFIPSLLENIEMSFRIVGAIIREIFESLEIVFENVGMAFNDTWKEFNVLSDGTVIQGPIQRILTLLLNLVYAFDLGGERAQLLYSVFRGLFSILELGKWVISNIIDLISPLLFRLASAQPIFLRVAAAVGDFIYAFVSAIINGTSMSGMLDYLLNTVADFFVGLFDLVFGEGNLIVDAGKSILDFVRGLGQDFINAILSIFEVSEDGTEGGFGGFLKRVFTEGGIIENALSIINKLFTKLSESFDGLWDIASSTFSLVPDILETTWGFIKDNSESISELVKSMINVFTKLFNKLGDLIDSSGATEKKETQGSKTFESFLKFLQSSFDVLTAINEFLTKYIFPFAGKVFDLLGKFADYFALDPERTSGLAAFFTIMIYLIKRVEYCKPFSRRLAELLTPVSKSAANLNNSIRGFFTTLASVTKSTFIQETFMEKLIKLAAALLIFAGAVWILAQAFTDSKGGINAGAVAGIVAIGIFLIAAYKLIEMAYRIEYMQNQQKQKLGDSFQQFSLVAVLKSIAKSVVLIMIGFAILAKVLDGVSLGAIITAGIVLAGIFVAFGILIKFILDWSSKAQSTNIVAMKQLKSMAVLIIALSVAIGLVMGSFAFAILTIAILYKAMGADGEKDALKIIGLAAGLIYVLMGALVGIMYVASQQQNYDLKGLIGMSVLLVAFGFAVGQILVSVAALIGILTLGPDLSVVVIAFAGIIVIMLALVLVIKAVAKSTAFGGSQMLAGLIGVSVMLVALGSLIGMVTAMAVAFKLAGVTSDDISNVIKILVVLGVIMVAMAGIFALVIGSSGTSSWQNLLGAAAGILAIAFAIKIIVDSFTRLILVMGLLFAVFELGAYFWPDLKDNFNQMLDDLGGTDGTDGILGKIIALVGVGIRMLCVEITRSAPYIADAVFSVMSTVLLITMQKAPAHALAWVMMIDQVLTIILKASGIIVDKFLRILDIVLIALGTNADVLGYNIGYVLMQAFVYALEGAFDALLDYIHDFVEHFYDELLGTWVDKASEMAFFDKIGDFIYKMMEGESLSETEARELKETQEYYAKKRAAAGEAINDYANDYDKSAAKAAKKIDAANENLQDSASGKKFKKTKEWHDVDAGEMKSVIGEVEDLKNNEQFKEVMDEYGVTDQALSNATTSGQTTADAFSTGMSEFLNSDAGNPIIQWLTNLKDQLSNNTQVKAAGSSLGEYMMTYANSAMTELLGSDKFDAGSYTKLMGTMYAAGGNWFSENGYGSVYSADKIMKKIGIPNGSQDLQNMQLPDGTYVDTTLYNPDQYGYNDTSAYTGYDTEEYIQTMNTVNDTSSKTNETMDNVNTTLGNLQKSLDNIIVIGKDTYIKINAIMDSKKVGEAVYPVTETIAADNQKLLDDNIAVTDSKSSGGTKMAAVNSYKGLGY